jgi:predicted mannosyl-3-phosphoglycerate phosphatase (HAD superfamily)
MQVMAAVYHRTIDPRALNAGDGNKDVPVIDRRADSVVIRALNAHMKLQTA